MRQETGDVEDVKNKHLLSTIASLLLVKKLFSQTVECLFKRGDFGLGPCSDSTNLVLLHPSAKKSIGSFPSFLSSWIRNAPSPLFLIAFGVLPPAPP